MKQQDGNARIADNTIQQTDSVTYCPTSFVIDKSCVSNESASIDITDEPIDASVSTDRRYIKNNSAEASADEKLNISKQLQRKHQLKNSLAYKAVTVIQKFMDTWYLDAIMGFLLPGIGDILTTVFVIPFIHISLFQIRSVPLTLAVIYNTMMDCLMGMVPLGIGDVIDVFHKSYKKNYRLIVGFVEDEHEIIKEVNRKAVYMAIMIVVLFVLIFCLFGLVINIGKYVVSLFS